MDKRTLMLFVVLAGIVVVIHYFVVAPMLVPQRPLAPVPPAATGTGQTVTPTPVPTPGTETAAGTETAPQPVPVQPQPESPPVAPAPSAVQPWQGHLQNEILDTTWTNDATGSCTHIRFRDKFYADTRKNPFYILGGSWRVDYEPLDMSGSAEAPRMGKTRFGDVLPYSFCVLAGDQAVRDDGSGKLVGDVNTAGTNRIDYQTGSFEVTFQKPIAAGTQPYCSYEPAARMAEMTVVGTGTGTEARFSGTLPHGPIGPGSVRITAGPQDQTRQLVYDDGNGKLTGDVLRGGNNLVDYERGSFDVTFGRYVAKGVEVTCQYNDRVPRVLDLGLIDPSVNLSGVRFEVKEATEEKIVFAGVIRQGQESLLEVTKTVTVPKDGFTIDSEFSLRNVSGRRLSFKYDVGAAEAIRVDDPKQPKIMARSAIWTPRGPWGFRSQDLKGIVKAPWIQPETQSLQAEMLWAGMENQYFAEILLAGPEQLMQQVFARAVYFTRPVPIPQPTIGVRMVSSALQLDPGQVSPPQKFRLLITPKRADVLARYESLGLGHLLDYGWFWPVAQVLLVVLHFFDRVVHNWGLAIILLTIVIRVLLHPLTKHSQVSMHRMQAIQPKIKELQAKYKNDKQKLGQEQMKLFREHGANPVSGCLPMLLQIPILIGLWRGLSVSFELRHAPFMLWMQDLSQPDALPIPGLGHINLLPILMTVAMFLQQLMTPQSPDPQTQQQQKILRFLPVIFGFMFYGFPSGLCLYWLTSTVLGMGEQYVIRRHLDKVHPRDEACEKPAHPRRA